MIKKQFTGSRVAPCRKCKCQAVSVGHCGYSTFNTGEVVCVSCGHSIKCGADDESDAKAFNSLLRAWKKSQALEPSQAILQDIIKVATRKDRARKGNTVLSLSKDLDKIKALANEGFNSIEKEIK